MARLPNNRVTARKPNATEVIATTCRNDIPSPSQDRRLANTLCQSAKKFGQPQHDNQQTNKLRNLRIAHHLFPSRKEGRGPPNYYGLVLPAKSLG